MKLDPKPARFDGRIVRAKLFRFFARYVVKDEDAA